MTASFLFYLINERYLLCDGLFHRLPKVIVRNGSDNLYLLQGYGMDEFSAAGVQADAAVFVGAVEAIFQVALDGAADLRQLTAYLMMTTCLEMDFEQKIAVGMGNHTVVQFCSFGVGMLFVVRIALVLLFIPDEPVHQIIFLFRRTILDDGPIGLLHFTVAKHVVEPCQRLAGLGKQHDAANRTIQTMRHADKDVPGFAILLLDPFLQHFRERLVARLVALDDLTARLVDGNDVIVFVDNFHDYMFMPPSIWITWPDT